LQISVENQHSWSQSFAHYFSGLVHYERNKLDEAIAELGHVFADPYRFPIQNVTHCSLLLSLCYQAKGMPDQAVEVAESIAKLTLERGNRLFIDLVRAFQAEIDSRQGRTAQAIQWARAYEAEGAPPLAMQRFFNAELTLVHIYLFHGNERDKKSAEERWV
jgi:ATP/maltotriose-dependent transcriptional regulator MalT